MLLAAVEPQLESVLGDRVTPLRTSVLAILAGAALYGAAVGSNAGVLLQVTYSALKLPLLLASSSVLCLPAVLTVTAVFGHASAGRELARHVLASQAVVALALASLAPVLVLVLLSTSTYQVVKLASGGCFALATLAGHAALLRRTRAARESMPAVRAAVRGWSVAYALVGIQLAWLLRPFVGAPGLPTRFLREDAWGNAYVHLMKTVYQVLGGS